MSISNVCNALDLEQGGIRQQLQVSAWIIFWTRQGKVTLNGITQIRHRHVVFGNSVRLIVTVVVIVLLLLMPQQQQDRRMLTNDKAACRFVPMTIMIGHGNSCIQTVSDAQ